MPADETKPDQTPPAQSDSQSQPQIIQTGPPTAASPPSKKMRKRTLFMIIAAMLVVGLIGGIWYLHESQFQGTDDATISGHLHPISARITGTVTQVLVEDNQMVKAGQTLVIIDPTDYKIALDQAQHNLDTAKAQADTAKANIAFTQGQANSQMTQARGGFGSQRASIAQAQASVAQTKEAGISAQQQLQQQDASYQKALSDYKRYAGADPEAISAQQLDLALTNLKVANAARLSALAGVGQAQAQLAASQDVLNSNTAKLTQSRGVIQGASAQQLQINVVQHQYDNAKAAIEVAQDAVNQAKLNLSYTHIIAPIDGRVGQKTVEVGQRVQVGEPMMSVVSPNVWVVANYKETQLQKMRPGQPVDVHVDAFPNHQFTGVVNSFSPASGADFALLPPENATGNYTKIVQRIPIKILLDPKTTRGYENLLSPGMSVVTSVHVSVDPNREKRRHAERHA